MDCGREMYVRDEVQFAMVLVDIVVVECNYGEYGQIYISELRVGYCVLINAVKMKNEFILEAIMKLQDSFLPYLFIISNQNSPTVHQMFPGLLQPSMPYPGIAADCWTHLDPGSSRSRDPCSK